MSSIGEQWQQSFLTQGTAYRTTLDARFIERFMRSPYIELPRRYARLGAGKSTLEAGCGSGKFSLCFARLGCDATALDFSSAITTNVEGLRQQAETSWGALSLRVMQGDIEHMEFANETFDFTCNEGVIEHWLNSDERLAVLREMARVTKRGGVVCVIVPNGRHPFQSFWMRYMPAYKVTPPMTDYTTRRLTADFTVIGLRDIQTDGIYPWRSLDQYPSWSALKWVGGTLQRLAPLPKQARERWGVNLIALGRKA